MRALICTLLQLSVLNSLRTASGEEIMSRVCVCIVAACVALLSPVAASACSVTIGSGSGGWGASYTITNGCPRAFMGVVKTRNAQNRCEQDPVRVPADSETKVISYFDTKPTFAHGCWADSSDCSYHSLRQQFPRDC
jgi:hypothetical protein